MIRELWSRTIRDRSKAKNGTSYYTPSIGKYHASQVYPNGCLRRKVLEFIDSLRAHGAPSDSMSKVFAIGEIMHRELQSMFKPEQCEVEIHIPMLDFEIIGRADVVLPDRIVEFKTWGRKSGEVGDAFLIKLPTKIEPKHLYQVECYMRGLNKRQATVVYIRKTDGEMVEFNIQKDERRWHEIVSTASLLHYHLSRDIVPAPTPDCKCKYCALTKQVLNGHHAEGQLVRAPA